jgi:hypothetical protein
MLLNIYARSMMVATRQPQSVLRDRATTQDRPIDTPPHSTAAMSVLASLMSRFKRALGGMRPVAPQMVQPKNCIDLQ